MTRLVLEFPDIETLERFNPLMDIPIVRKNHRISRVSQTLPNRSGVYFLFYNNILLYIGISNNIQGRIGSHLNDKIFNQVSYLLEEDLVLRQVYELLYFKKYCSLLQESRIIEGRVVIAQRPNKTYMTQEQLQEAQRELIKINFRSDQERA